MGTKRNDEDWKRTKRISIKYGNTVNDSRRFSYIKRGRYEHFCSFA